MIKSDAYFIRGAKKWGGEARGQHCPSCMAADGGRKGKKRGENSGEKREIKGKRGKE